MANDRALRLADLDPRHVPDALAASRRPFLVGVRHHSAALAAAMPALLESFSPTVVLIELPADLGAWIPWLGSPELVAPVALSATSPDGSLSFYPFADFSPELAAIRWARRSNVPVEAIDRPVSAREIPGPVDSPRAGRLVGRLEGGNDTEALWDTMVEARAPSVPEDLRRAALSFGWLLRADTLHGGEIPPEDAEREAHMRACIARANAKEGSRVCAVVGAFHANALLEQPVLEKASTAASDASEGAADRVGALVPYDFELLDSRSGYPAGIRDPSLVQRAFELFSTGQSLEAALPDILVEIARALREKGHVASFSDVREAARMARDLASLRGLRSPSRRELLEAIESSMAQGEPLGRGRVLARALETVLVGHRRGRLPEDTPRRGLSFSVESLLEELGMPGPRDAKEPKELTLDPERSPKDRKRAIVLGQLEACGIPYAEKRARAVGGARGRVDNLTMRVSARYTPETAARLEMAGLFGATLEAAAEGTLRRGFALLHTEGTRLSEGWLAHLVLAASAGLVTVTAEILDRLPDTFLPNAGLSDLAQAFMLIARIDEGHVATLPRHDEGDPTRAFSRPLASEREAILFAALRALLGMVGSTNEDDVRALGELLALFAESDMASLHHAISTFVMEGSPLMRGAGMAAQALLGTEDATCFFATFVSFFDQGGHDARAAAVRMGTLRGALLLAGPIFEGHPGFAESITAGIDRLDDTRFLQVLPSLRGGFDVLSAADRQRLLDVLHAIATPHRSLTLAVSPQDLEAFVKADRAGKEALSALGLLTSERMASEAAEAPSEAPRGPYRTDHAIAIDDRLRLILGREASALSQGACRYARALDELYGHGHGEGSRGGAEASYPTAREWGDELQALFGEAVREEVLGRAATLGHGATVTLLDPERVTPSIELLEQILSLKGGLSEGDFVHLKLLANRVVAELVKELAKQTRPALTGLATPRASRRRSGPLDLRRTIQQNLATAYVEDAVFRLAPRSFTFRARAKKSLDWRIVLVVDVSGSMEPSVLHSAMMAGILGNLPAVSTHFLAVNDKVVDLSHQAADPLELLLSVRIGGGTLLAKGLRHARGLLTVPMRSIVILVSDFEEGGSVGDLIGEVAALRESGASLLGLAALGERNAPRYHRGIAEQLVTAGMPIAALSPLELARWVGEKLRGAQ